MDPGSATLTTNGLPLPRFAQATVLMGFKPGTSAAREQAIERAVGAIEVRVIGAGTHVLRVVPGRVLSVIALLKSVPAVRYAEPNYLVSGDAIPNDPRFGQLWGLRNTGQRVHTTSGTPEADIAVVPAWSVSTGSRGVVVGVLDTGVDYRHPDLAANVWTNPGGIGGCPAGTHGVNVLASGRRRCDPIDGAGHGTHIAGTIGAVGNNRLGVVGVAWRTRIMALKFLRGSCFCATNADAIAAIDFALIAKRAGVNVRVLNASWGCCFASGGAFPYSQALLDEIKRAGANDILFVASAGNTGADNDLTPHYPCSYGNPDAIVLQGEEAATNVICVAASDQNDGLAEFSDYGDLSVDLAAPGVNILSTAPSRNYGYKSGTSMATAYVSGAAALVLSRGYRSTSDLKAAILGSVDPLPSLLGRVKSGGRLNVCRALGPCA